MRLGIKTHWSKHRDPDQDRTPLFVIAILIEHPSKSIATNAAKLANWKTNRIENGLVNWLFFSNQIENGVGYLSYWCVICNVCVLEGKVEGMDVWQGGAFKRRIPFQSIHTCLPINISMMIMIPSLDYFDLSRHIVFPTLFIP